MDIKVIKFLPILLISALLNSCSNTNQTSDLIDQTNKNSANIISTEKEIKIEKTIKPNDVNGKSVKFEIIEFDEKSTEDIIDFFNEYNLNFVKNNNLKSNFILDEKNEYHDGNNYDENNFPNTPSVAWSIYKNKLNMITTTDLNNRSDLVLRTLDLDNNFKDTILMSDVLYRQPYYFYDDNKLYYSTIKTDGTSFIGSIDLEKLRPKEIVKYEPILKNNRYRGEIITLISKLNDEIVYQLSTYNNQALNDTKPLKNKLVYLSDADRNIDLGDNNYDVIQNIDSYIITHDTGYNNDEYLVKIYDTNFNLLYKLDNNQIDRVVGLTLLNKNENDYLLIMDGLQTFYIVDLKNNKDNYQLNNMSTLKRIVENNENGVIISSKEATFVGDKK